MMRLWHYKLVPVLPKAQLISQWRECLAIKRQWEKGTLKHRLVSYVMDYDRAVFFSYVLDLLDEMDKRKIKYQSKFVNEFIKFSEVREKFEIQRHYPEHNDRYLKQCLYNLEEKATREIISKEEWQKIYDKFKNFTDLWKGK